MEKSTKKVEKGTKIYSHRENTHVILRVISIEGKYPIARNLLKAGTLKLEAIAPETDLSIEELKKIS